MKKALCIEENVSLKKYNTFGIGGLAKNVYWPASADELKKYLKNNEGLKYFILGGGSNIILPDEDFDGTVICTKKLRKIKISKYSVKVDAGVMLSFFNNALLKRGYPDFVWSAAIPATVGGALMGNAGCHGHAMFDNLISITVIKNGRYKTIKKSSIKHGYRYTNLEDVIIVSAEFNVKKGEFISSLDNLKNWSDYRLKTQPIGTKNAGSTFKNPEGTSAGYLIDQAGLKGYSINGAKVSEVHANFIINDGSATSKDIKDLIEHIKKEVKRIHDVDLEVENEFINW